MSKTVISENLSESLRHALRSLTARCTRSELTDILDILGIPGEEHDESATKADLVERRFRLLSDSDIPAVCEKVLATYREHLDIAARFSLEENYWSKFKTSVRFDKALRYSIANKLAGEPLFLESDGFLTLVVDLWEKNHALISFPFTDRGPIAEGVHQHTIRNNDWDFDTLFRELKAFDSSDHRFRQFLERLNNSDVRPDIHKQRSFAACIQAALLGTGLTYREISGDDGFLKFEFTGTGARRNAPRNLIFASKRKPDIRFSDVIEGEIEVLPLLEGPQPLVYDRPFTRTPLTWKDIQDWWQETNGISDDQAKTSLYSRLKQSIPDESPPQETFFLQYHRIFKKSVVSLPALLPEVWLHWDPEIARARGPLAMKNFRMDFLMLFSSAIRVVIEIDGMQHYSDSNGPSPEKYARMAEGDRDLRFAGYEVYRIGAWELSDSRAENCVRKFFCALFDRHNIPYKL